MENLSPPPVKSHTECIGVIRPVRDALDILQGKWKLNIIVTLMFGRKRFTEIAKEIPGITDKMLSKELRDLEINHLVKRTQSEGGVAVEYTMTTHGKTLVSLIDDLRDWGITHRKIILGNHP